MHDGEQSTNKFNFYFTRDEYDKKLFENYLTSILNQNAYRKS